ncbi:serine/threonine-protein kinase [Nocardioides sp.]|uniref:serine/threonine-protein kinase n=1 Tax=Nocardioides sp. TaxID=35761 RepID=UPI002B26A9E7|nr:serine/threonine-protein kinase [Nocardioides sp.]
MSGLPSPGSLYASRYRIERQIGRGGVGVVYEAHDESLDRPVAVKIVRAAEGDHHYADRFAREAQMQARTRSRHTVTVHEHGELDGNAFLVTDLMPDGDLHTWLMREGPLPWRAALSVTAQVCEALEDAHRAGIVHRDVKPSNVLLWSRADGLIAFLCDFGIAAFIGDPVQRAATEAGAVVGSPAYMPPERLQGTGGDDERGDVYAVGCVLWATLTGEAPYLGTDLDVMMQHVQAPVPQLDTGDPVDDQIDALLRKVLAKDPDDRLPSAEAFRYELRKIHSAVAGAPAMSGLHPLPPSVSAARARLFEGSSVEPGGASPDASGSRHAATEAVRTAVQPVHGRPEQPAPPEPLADRLKRRASRWRTWPTALGIGLAVSGLVATLAADPDARANSAERVLVAGAVSVPASTPVATQQPAPTPTPAPTTAPAPTDPTDPTDPTAELLALAVAPRVRTTPAYRAVRFSYEPPVQVPGVAVRVEYLRGGAWTTAEQDLVRYTGAGGRTTCLRFRSVVETDEGAVTQSPVNKFCDTSLEPTLRIVASDKPCAAVSRGFVYDCRWYGVRLAGFAPGTNPLVEVVPDFGRSYCAAPVPGSTFECRTVRIDDQGRGRIRQYVRIGTTSKLTMRVGDVSTTATLSGP